MEYIRILVIGSHSHCNDCDMICVSKTEHANSASIQPYQATAGKVVGFKPSDRTLVVSCLLSPAP